MDVSGVRLAYRDGKTRVAPASRVEGGGRLTSEAIGTAVEVPFVSVVIPCVNEARFIGPCLESIIANTYPKERCEVLVVDGLSDDGTREIVGRYCERYRFIQLLDNPKRWPTAAFNIGARQARGEVVMIMGAHASYDTEYIRLCVHYLNAYDADNVGGVLKTVPREATAMGNAIAAALSHRFGVGNSRFRIGSRQPVWVDTVFGGCYRREVFERIGYWNEDLRFGQDIEFNRRLVKAGGKILLAPDIVFNYYARSELDAFIKHSFHNGLWAALLLFQSNVVPIGWRHVIPGLFVSGLVCLALSSLISSAFLAVLGIVCVFYLAMAVLCAVQVARRERDLRYLVLLPLTFATLHFAYGLGSVWGVLRMGWKAFMRRH